MKLRLMIALVILALVFGMTFIACDDGELPTIKKGEKEIIWDVEFIATGVNDKGELQGPKSDTTGAALPDIEGFIPEVPPVTP